MILLKPVVVSSQPQFLIRYRLVRAIDIVILLSLIEQYLNFTIGLKHLLLRHNTSKYVIIIDKFIANEFLIEFNFMADKIVSKFISIGVPFDFSVNVFGEIHNYSPFDISAIFFSIGFIISVITWSLYCSLQTFSRFQK